MQLRAGEEVREDVLRAGPVASRKAEVAVDGRLAYVHDFKVRPYFTGAEQRPDLPLGKRHDWH